MLGGRWVAVFLISTAVLAFEILLLRLFAIEQFHHFAYMAVSVAMLGFGASGTALVLLARRVAGREDRLFALLAAMFAVALAATPPLLRLVPFEPTALPWQKSQWLALGAVYALLALPFLLGAAAIALALMAEPRQVARLYGASLAGSAAGALLALAVLVPFPPARAAAIPAVVAAAAAALALWRTAQRRRWALGGAAALGAGAFAAFAFQPHEPRITPYKGLPQVEAYPGARRVATRTGPMGWIVATRAPAFRYAPGLSLAFRGTIPPQTALFVDGQNAGAATHWRGDSTALAFLDWLPSALAYRVGRPGRVLVLGSGAGLEALAALRHGARRVVAVDLNGPLLRLSEAVVDPASRVYADPRVVSVVADARAYAARRAEQFDLVVLPSAETFGAAAAGLHALGEDYLNTVEAYRGYLRLLAPHGVLAVTRWVRTPARDNLKALFTAAAALREIGISDVGRSLALFRSWATATLLVRPAGFDADELRALSSFADERLFDADWYPGIRPERLDRFNALDRPTYYEAARAAAAGADSTAAFIRRYPFDVRPTRDDRPFFGHFLRLASLPGLFAMGAGSWLPFAEWGYLALLAALLQGALLAALLMLAPALVVRRRAHRFPLARVTVYFGAIGLGYIGAEIAFIQKLQLLLGHPVYAATAVLFAFLAFSGLGSLLSDRWPGARTWWAPAGVAALLSVAALAIAPAASALASAPRGVRAAGSIALVAPLATLMGVPFAAGVRLLVGERRDRLAWAWAVNGFGSVVAASLASVVAVEAGFRAVLLLSAVLYAAAAFAGARVGEGREEAPSAYRNGSRRDVAIPPSGLHT